MNNSSTNVIEFPKLGRIPTSSIALLHQLAATWSLDEPAPLIVVFGATDEQEDWCMFLDGLTDEPRYSFWKDGKSLHYVDYRASLGPHDETRGEKKRKVTSSPYLVKLIELIDPAYTKRKANE